MGSKNCVGHGIERWAATFPVDLAAVPAANRAERSTIENTSMGKLRGIVSGHAAATAERGDPVDPPGDEPSQIRRTSVLGARPVDREGLRKEWTALHTFADARLPN